MQQAHDINDMPDSNMLAFIRTKKIKSISNQQLHYELYRHLKEFLMLKMLLLQ